MDLSPGSSTPRGGKSLRTLYFAHPIQTLEYGQGDGQLVLTADQGCEGMDGGSKTGTFGLKKKKKSTGQETIPLKPGPKKQDG